MISKVKKPMTLKEQAIKLIMSLPNDYTLEVIQYHLYVYQKVERGISAIDVGAVVPQDEVEKRIKDLLKR